MASPCPGGGRPTAVQTLQEEAICAICLDYFADPVSIGCGHNFCRGCIARLWDDGAEVAAGEGDAGEDEQDEDDGAEEEEEEEEEDDDDDDDEEDEMWSEEEDEAAELWDEDAAEEEEEEEEQEIWDGGTAGATDGVYFGEDYDEDVMEEDVEEEEEDEEEDEEEEEAETPPPQIAAAPARRPPPFTCPQCRKTFFQRNFRPNLQLANMVQIIRQLHPHPQRSGASGAPGLGNRGPPDLCERHQEPLKLFCEVDEEAICVVCRESRGHKQHSVVPLEEVVQEYKNKLQRHLEPLKQKLDAVLKQKSHEEAKITELREQMRLELQELQSELEALQRFLLGEQVQQLQQLESRFQGLLARQSRNVAALETQRTALERLIGQAQDTARQDGLQLIKDIKGTFIRCENVKFQEPEMVPVDVGKKYRNCFLQDVVMRKMEKVFSKVPKAEVTLDPASAHPRLALSLDRRSVKLAERRPPGPEGAPKRPDGDFCVLGSPGFTAGRHYWEVEIAGRRGWAVGAAARRRDRAHPQKREVWCVGTNGKRYQACGGAEQTALAPGERPRRFGVYLDYDRGQLGFYNADTMGHIHTFRAAFRERLFPFFRVLGKGTRIRICA